MPRQRPASARQARPPSAGPRRRVASARRRGAKDSHVLRLVGAPERPEDVAESDEARVLLGEWVAADERARAGHRSA